MAMRPRNRLRKTLLAPIVVASLALVVSGAALAASDVGTLITAGDDGAATARGAQQPLGALSATPPAPVAPRGGNPNNGGGGNPGGGEKGDGGGGGGGNGGGGNGGGGGEKGDDGSGSGSTIPGGGSSGEPAGNVAGASASLPFTGFLAIPVLLIGAALLISGIVLRRRSSAPSAS